jgi:hypothetical protein
MIEAQRHLELENEEGGPCYPEVIVAALRTSFCTVFTAAEMILVVTRLPDLCEDLDIHLY